MLMNNSGFYSGHRGVWAIYDSDESVTPKIEILSIHFSPVDALVMLANYGYGKPAFIPAGMEMAEAMSWWENERKKFDSNSATPSTRSGGETS